MHTEATVGPADVQVQGAVVCILVGPVDHRSAFPDLVAGREPVESWVGRVFRALAAQAVSRSPVFRVDCRVVPVHPTAPALVVDSVRPVLVASHPPTVRMQWMQQRSWAPQI
jgi:hypothetical protein